MPILEPKLSRDLEAGIAVKLDLGSGGAARPGYYGVDLREAPGVALVCNLEQGLPLPDNCASEIYSSHFFEHVRDLNGLMRECQRVLRPGGRMDIIVPHFSCPYYYADPTHVRFFGIYTMNYYAAPGGHKGRAAPRYEPDINFVVDDVSIQLIRRRFDRIATPFLGDLINSSFEWLDRYERRLCRLAPAYTVRYQLTVAK